MAFTASDGQSLLDVALMVAGSVEAVWDIAEANGMGVTDCLMDGDELRTDGTGVVDGRVVERYRLEGICPATEVGAEELAFLVWDSVRVFGREFNLKFS